jgi:hypothetical protein
MKSNGSLALQRVLWQASGEGLPNQGGIHEVSHEDDNRCGSIRLSVGVGCTQFVGE